MKSTKHRNHNTKEEKEKKETEGKQPKVSYGKVLGTKERKK